MSEETVKTLAEKLAVHLSRLKDGVDKALIDPYDSEIARMNRGLGNVYSQARQLKDRAVSAKTPAQLSITIPPHDNIALRIESPKQFGRVVEVIGKNIANYAELGSKMNALKERLYHEIEIDVLPSKEFEDVYLATVTFVSPGIFGGEKGERGVYVVRAFFDSSGHAGLDGPLSHKAFGECRFENVEDAMANYVRPALAESKLAQRIAVVKNTEKYNLLLTALPVACHKYCKLMWPGGLMRNEDRDLTPEELEDIMGEIEATH